MSGHKTLSPPGPMNYLRGIALRIWISFWRREGSAGMNTCNAQMVQSRQPFTYRLGESMGMGGPRWHGSSWQRGIVESGSSWLSTLMIEICGDWCEICHACSKPAIWKGAHWCRCCHCTCTLIKNPIMIRWWCHILQRTSILYGNKQNSYIWYAMYEKGPYVIFVNNAGPDQRAHKHRLTRAFIVRLQNQWIQ